jgi:hypothetical protein
VTDARIDPAVPDPHISTGSAIAAIAPAQGQAILIVVRRGAAGRFATLHGALGGEDGVAVVWDRRAAERRLGTGSPPAGGERRVRDRRGPAPPSWGLLDFVVVPA